MGEKTKIEWTDATWNPVRARNRATGKIGWNCQHVTPGCEHCYAESINKRLGTGLPFKPGHLKDVEMFLDEEMLLAPLKWKRPRMIFVCSMTDLFADFVPDEQIDRMFAVMALCPQHTFQCLTKRPARMWKYFATSSHSGCKRNTDITVACFALDAVRNGERAFSDKQCLVNPDRWPLSNVWLGVSAEDQQRADERIPDLLATPAAVRFVSYEPALGPIQLGSWQQEGFYVNLLKGYDGVDPPIPGIRWIICGGESGPHARPMNPAWVRDVRDQCKAAGVAFFHKQNGEFASVSEVAGPGEHFTFSDGATVRRVGKRAAGRLLDGREWNEMPGRQ